ncbi:unnamed protein product [Amaranthus hypochondriacus]
MVRGRGKLANDVLMTVVPSINANDQEATPSTTSRGETRNNQKSTESWILAVEEPIAATNICNQVTKPPKTTSRYGDPKHNQPGKAFNPKNVRITIEDIEEEARY